MDTLNIPEYVVSDGKTTYGDLRHVSQRIAAPVKYMVQDIKAGRQPYCGTTVYKRRGEEYVVILTGQDFLNLAGTDYNSIKKTLLKRVKEA